MFTPQEPSESRSSRKPKPVQYRPRHKRLEHLEKEVTAHGFEQRLKVPHGSQPADPVYCSVWGMNDEGTAEITINSKNYRSALDRLGDSTGFGDRHTPQKSTRASSADNFERGLQQGGSVPSHQRPRSTQSSSFQNYDSPPAGAENMYMSQPPETGSNYSGYCINSGYSTDRHTLYHYPDTPDIPETEEQLMETELEHYINSASQFGDDTSRQEWALYQHQAETVMRDYRGFPAVPRAGAYAQGSLNTLQYTENTHSGSFNPHLERYSNEQERYRFP